MATTTYTGNGAVSSADYHTVKLVGKTKGGAVVTIKCENALNMGNIELATKEKDDVVAACTFEACYDNTDEMADDFTEPWSIEVNGTMTAGASEIMLGACLVYIDTTEFGLCRGGATFTVTREYREINADGDRGAVKDRVVLESSRASITINTLQVLNSLASLYPGVTKASS